MNWASALPLSMHAQLRVRMHAAFPALQMHAQVHE